MPFIQHQGFAKVHIDKPISLERTHIDPATLTLTFIYQELVQDGDEWLITDRAKVLVRDEHYRLDRRRGVVMLIDHLFWHQEGRWTAADRVEPLLYKGQVKHPQRIDFDYEHYQPEEVEVAKVTDETDQEAKRRLGYDLPKYAITTELSVKPVPFDWEDKP